MSALPSKLGRAHVSYWHRAAARSRKGHAAAVALAVYASHDRLYGHNFEAAKPVPLNVHCFLDESRDAGPPAFSAVAALCGFKGRWEDFEFVGRSILKRHGYEAIHATDIFRGKRYRKGPFKGVSDASIAALMRELFESAGKHDVAVFARAMFEDTHGSQKAVLDKSHDQTPYGACYSLLIDVVLQTCVEHDLRLWLEWENKTKSNRRSASPSSQCGTNTLCTAP